MQAGPQQSPTLRRLAVVNVEMSEWCTCLAYAAQISGLHTRFVVARKLVSVVCSAPYGEWRSPVARSVRDAEVGGSNPLSPTVRLGVVCITSPIFCMVKHQRAAIGREGDAWTMSHTGRYLRSTRLSVEFPTSSVTVFLLSSPSNRRGRISKPFASLSLVMNQAIRNPCSMFRSAGWDHCCLPGSCRAPSMPPVSSSTQISAGQQSVSPPPVSYTHLTLPT